MERDPPVRAPKPTIHVDAGDQPASITPSNSVTPLCITLRPSSVCETLTGTNAALFRSYVPSPLRATSAPANHTSTTPSLLKNSTDRWSPAPRSSKYVCGMFAPMLKLMPSPPTGPPPMYRSKSTTNSVISPMSGTLTSIEPMRSKSSSVSCSIPPEMYTSSSAAGPPKSSTPLLGDAKSSCTSEPEPVASAIGDLHRSCVELNESATTLVLPKRHCVSNTASTKPEPSSVSTVPPSTGPDTTLRLDTDAAWYVNSTLSVL